ncbi:hypothetical protein B0T19DRAFT_103662 [Cercophora scortea]|uniref:Vacuolar ATPase assembly protein VMA22 n=1 Tax=Cercophora scortea TaxID=314031 RepID=A0AAE0IXQ2_9PEZI|nr:hypothetical protein B0T19DRAFT_103662 [Cercophora scortea]
MSSPADNSPSIDDLLERYLTLLDEYTKLRASLTALQSTIYQDIARANFAAERGVRFGQDYYDARMQASRKVGIRLSESTPPQHPVFSVIACAESDEPASDVKAETETDAEIEADEDEKTPKQKKKKKPTNDPLRWFGGALSTPTPLRHAQSQAIQAVEDLVPRLATVSAAMAAVEVEVRRSRKRRAKAEAAAAREKEKEGERGMEREKEGVTQDEHDGGAVAVL